MKKYINLYIIFIVSFYINSVANGQTIKILFDATKAETSGNADWVIDADQANLGYNWGYPVLGQGDESNAQQYPTPSQSLITSLTQEYFWRGALSSWGIDCAKNGYEVESLPFLGTISYGNSSNDQDLSKYNVFIVCEPNIQFLSFEKAAIINFVANGGSLFMISDHDQSDRNGDGWDSPHIWNDLMYNNTVQNDPFGIKFDYDSFSETSTNVRSVPNDSILNGPMGIVSKVQWSSGTTMSLNEIDNPTVRPVIFRDGFPQFDFNVLCAYSYYGKGKVAAIGDSSPCDDGTGDGNDQLYDGYIQDASGNHRRLLMNITIWLATNNFFTGINKLTSDESELKIFPVPARTNSTIKFSLKKSSNVSIDLFDLDGRKIKSIKNEFMNAGDYFDNIDVAGLNDGIYVCKLNADGYLLNSRLIKIH